MFCQNSENAEDHAPFLTPVTTGCAIRNVDPSFQCCYHQFQQSNKSLVKRSASSSNQINRWQKEMPLTFPTSLVVQLADPREITHKVQYPKREGWVGQPLPKK
jgi:hypothetical protein